MKKLLLPIVLCLLALSTKAQEEVRFDRLYLHGGSFLKGQIIDTLRGGIIQLKLQNDSMMSVPISLIHKVKQSDRHQQLFADGRTAISDGIYSRLSFQLLSGTGNGISYSAGDYRVDPSFGFAMGVYLHKWLAVGVGTGIDFYVERRVVPLYLESRVYWGKNSRSPFVGMQLGYSFLMDKREFFDGFEGKVRERGGVMFYPSIGYRFAGKGKTDFMIDIGYKFQPHYFRVDYPEGWGTISEVERRSYNSLSIRFGWVF